MEYYKQEELKKAINNLLWMYLPDNITLKEADELACQILESIRKKYGTIKQWTEEEVKQLMGKQK